MVNSKNKLTYDIYIFKAFHSVAIYPLLRLISWSLTTQCLAVTGGCSVVGECSRLSQSSWLLAAL